MAVKIRNFVDSDLPNLIHLLNEIYKGEYEFVPYTEEGLRAWLQEGKLKILIAEENGKVVGSAAYADTQWGELIRWLAVTENESSTKKIIEHDLVCKVEKFVKGATVFTAVDAESPKINDWIELGYKPEGGLYQMIARLDSVKPLPPVPEGIILRSLRHDEEAKLVETVNTSFGWERLKAGIIERWKSECPPFSEEWVHVAELNGKIISVVGSRPDAEYEKFFGGKRGYLGPAATLPEHRNKNVVSALTQRAMNLLFEKGIRSTVLHTGEQNIPSVTLLRKLGFKVDHQWKFMRKTLAKP
jgi:ribosomal protein S18 acetylase RimI-like enzyme